MRVSRKNLRKLSWLAIVALLVQIPSSAQGEETKPAFVSPDSRKIQVGFWQGFFHPNAFLPLSYLPNFNAVTDFQKRIFGAVLPPCDGNQTACISQVEYQLPGGDWKPATPTSDLTQRDVFQGSLLPNGEWELHYTSQYSEDLNKNRPQGDAARLWVFSDASHGGGNTYQVSAQLTGGYESTDRYMPDNFVVQVIPQKRVRVESTDAPKNCLEPQSTFIRSKPTDTVGNCVTNYDFPKELNIRIKIKLASFLNSINGWFDSRIRDLTIDIDEMSRTMTLEGKPLIVPTAATRQIKYEELESQGLNPVSKNVQEIQTRSNLGTGGSYQLNTPQTINEFIKIGKNLLPSALGENTIWQINSLPQFYYENTKCLNKGIINGIVSTNATVYDSTAPKWNDDDSSLNFRVGAAHHLSNKDVFRGYYSMIVNNVTARCYWGNNLANASASISVLGENGEQNVATTSVVTRNNWTYFNASGFTFSTPTIKVKYVAPTPTPTPTPVMTASPTPTPSASPTPSVTSTPSPVSNQIKKITITCIKGKLTKKVTGIKPICPIGYKKK
jgi:hypothetical protein